MTLEERLAQYRNEVRAALEPAQWQVLVDSIERLRMLQLVEQGLHEGDQLPEFALPDTDGLTVASDALLDRGPLAIVFIRGTWCPYCSATLDALEQARPRIEQLGGSLVVVSPMAIEDLARAAAARGLGLRLLGDPGGAYAKLCGVQYQMSDAHVALFRSFDLDIGQINQHLAWELPVPACFVAGSNGVITYAFADADWTRRAEPDAILAAMERTAQAAAG